MKLVIVIVIVGGLAAGCSSGPKPAPDYAPLPDDPRLPAAGPATATATAATDPACMPDGAYAVTVDLSSAIVTQANTGMGDDVWCRSMLAAVPAQGMDSMTIARSGGRLTVEWPAGHAVAVDVTGPCGFAVTAPPMPTTFTFAAGTGAGTSTYTIGTQNHPDESCTATAAKVMAVPLGQP